MDMDQRWLHRRPADMLDTFHWFRGEAFNLVIDDLTVTPTDGPVVAEGFRLLPHLVQPLLTDASRAVWLLPTPQFRQAAFESRGTLWDIAAKTTNPARALHNLLERDRLFTDRLRQETQLLGLPGIEVDTTLSVDVLTDQVAHTLGL